VQYLADGVDAGGSSKRWPKVFPDVLGGIDTDTVDAVVPDQSLNPAVECLDDPRVLRIHIRWSKLVVAQPTLFDVRLVVVISDETPGMEVAGFIERVEECVRS